MTKVALCNRALTIIGEEGAVTALSPPTGSAHAQRCATLLDDAIELVTESRHWTFADRRAPLSKVSLGTVTGYTTESGSGAANGPR